MRKVQQRPTSTFVNIEGNGCAADVFVIHAHDDRCAVDIIATHRDGSKAVCADSESQNLAIKKFFMVTALASHGRSPKPFFWTNRGYRFGHRFSVVAINFGSRRATDARLRALIITATARSRPVTGRF
jgi:hypothetical protein